MKEQIKFIQSAHGLDLNKEQALKVLIDLLAMRNGAKPKSKFEIRYGHEVRRVAEETAIYFYGGRQGRYVINSIAIDDGYIVTCTPISVEKIKL